MDCTILMIECPSVEKRVIQNHYDVSTLFYRLLWGPHIHHGYWDANEPIRMAQVRLPQNLANLAQIKAASKVIDVGCGMGGSSIWLAKELGCDVTGITISPVQRRWAALSSRWQWVSNKTNFLCCDAESVEFRENDVDYLWSIECTEHFFDKANFFKRSARWLNVGGRFALCAWLAGDPPLSQQQREQAVQVCEGMFCPSLGSQADYVRWFEEAGLKIVHMGIWTRHVERTWEICKRRVDRTGVRFLANILGKNHTLFLNHFESILNAYRTGAMEYGYFIAEKPS